MKFIDEVSVIVASGKGGPGCVSFRRESMNPRGGPDGGDGGKGGDIVFKIDPHLNSLIDLHHSKTLRAANGEPGKSQNMSGKNGDDLVIRVPRGTVLKDDQGKIIADLGTISELVLLKGGLGGRGNTFYKSSVNQAPTVAQKGLPGQEMSLHLELKLLADVGIIGFPNAGKSTLISAISAAKPKVADYPFTTLTPHLGVVRYGQDRSFVAADIPGLVVGAHRGVGLGTQFLRHIQRTRVFIHLIDGSELSLRDPVQDYLDINEELRCYDQLHGDEEGFEPLMERPQIVVLNKSETINSQRARELESSFKDLGVEPLFISAVTRKNLDSLVYAAGRWVFRSDDEVKSE